MNKVILIVGPTGSGKTTFRNRHLSNIPCVSPDDFVIGKWSNDKCYLAHLHAFRMAQELCNNKESFSVDEQFTRGKERKVWQELAKKNGYNVEAFILVTPWEQILKNQESRGERGFYGKVPDYVVKENYDRFTTQLKNKSLFHGFDNYQVINWGEIQSTALSCH